MSNSSTSIENDSKKDQLQQPSAFYSSPIADIITSSTSSSLSSDKPTTPTSTLLLYPEPLSKLLSMKTMFPEEIEDRDVAIEPPLGTSLGNLRRQVISLQREINKFLTERMKQHQHQQQQSSSNIITNNDTIKNNKNNKNNLPSVEQDEEMLDEELDEEAEEDEDED